MSKRILKGAMVGAGAIIVIAGVMMSVLLRDGLGPDSIQSFGWEALYRIIIQSLPYIVVGGLLIITGVRLRIQRNMEEQNT